MPQLIDEEVGGPPKDPTSEQQAYDQTLPAPRPPRPKPAPLPRPAPSRTPDPGLTFNQQAYEEHQQQRQKDFNSFVSDRLRSFPDEFINQNPVTAAWLATAPISEHLMRTIPQHWNALASYVDQADSVGDVPGGLTIARIKALNIKNDQLRTQSL